MDKLKLLIADDEPTAREGLRRALSKKDEITESDDGLKTWGKILSDQPDIVLLDINMPKGGGFQVLKKTLALRYPPLFVMITAYGSERIAVEAMKAGAFDYVAKPFNLDELRLIISRASEKILLQRENRRLKNVISRKTEPLLIGNCEAMKKVHEIIEKVANTDVSVLITGESGTGKDLVAQLIQKHSSRSDDLLLILNCAAIPRELIESELFGYAKGAFTGAIKDTKGKFQIANGGTLFLDEVGDMSLETQAKVLRVLEEQIITPVGSTKSIPVDVRIISATNYNLQRLIEKELFREDLYYRLRVIEIIMPPLRERGADIMLLSNHFLKMYSSIYDKDSLEMTKEASDLILSHSWPGNIRELRNVFESTVVLSENSLDLNTLRTQIHGQHKRGYYLRGRSFQEAKQNYVIKLETNLITESLIRSNGNISKAADFLGMKRQYLQHKLKLLKIDARKFMQ